MVAPASWVNVRNKLENIDRMLPSYETFPEEVLSLLSFLLQVLRLPFKHNSTRVRSIY